MKSALAQIVELVRRESGIALKPTQRPALEAALRRTAPELDPTGFARLATDPVVGRRAIDRLIEEVTIKETFFFRDRRQLDAIDWHALLEGARAGGGERVRVWVAGCASGEEAYTLALLACEAFAPLAPPVDVLATDISSGALARAEAGRYHGRRIAAIEPALRTRYFHEEGRSLVVGERLRRLVEFERHNLVRDPVPPLGREPFDLVVCRNVLIYFDSDTVEQVIGALETALRPNGMLLLGAADQLCDTALRLAGFGIAASSEPVERPRPVRELRRPLGRVQRPPFEERLAATLRAADGGRTDEAIEQAAELLAEDPLNADVCLLLGMAQLEAGDARAAIGSLRRALYVDPYFGLAAFKLARAYDAAGETAAARRAYEQALRSLQPDDDRHELILAQVDLGDVAAACGARLAALR